MKFADCTKYPKIFADTYWGCFTVSSADYDTACYFAARNKFVENYDIAKLSRAKRVHGGFFDHPELYYTSAGRYIFVCSPYCFGYAAGDNLKLATQYDFMPIPQMYHPWAYTFMRGFSSLPEYTRFRNKMRKLDR
jgi:hypothetical protein